MDLGAVGNAILFVCTLAGTAIVGFYVLGYAAHCLLVVVQGTAAQTDEVVWTDEPIVDWLGRAMSVLGLALIWLIPAGILSRALSKTFLVDAPALRTLLLAVPGLWLFFPVGLLSSLSATSRWVFFRPAIAWSFFRIFPSAVAFYLVSALLAAMSVYPWFVTLFGGWPWLLLAAPFSAALLLIYARLLGRLAWLIQRLKPVRRTTRKPTPARPKAARPKVKAEVHDPWAGPVEEPETPPSRPKQPLDSGDEWDQDNVRSGYGLSDPAAPLEDPEKASKQARPLDPEEEDVRSGYGLNEEPRPQQKGTEEPENSSGEPEAESRSGKRKPAVKTSRPGRLSWPLLTGVYGFPWRGDTFTAWVWLSFGHLVLGVCLLGLLTFWPGG